MVTISKRAALYLFCFGFCRSAVCLEPMDSKSKTPLVRAGLQSIRSRREVLNGPFTADRSPDFTQEATDEAKIRYRALRNPHGGSATVAVFSLYPTTPHPKPHPKKVSLEFFHDKELLVLAFRRDIDVQVQRFLLEFCPISPMPHAAAQVLGATRNRLQLAHRS